MGAPKDWSIVDSWLAEGRVPYASKEPDGKAELNWPKIGELSDYRVSPEESFWKNFLKRNLPLTPSTAVNKSALRKMLKECKSKITSHQWRRGIKCLQDLADGANAAQKSELPPITVRNAESAFENGRLLTDKIATWVESGFVAGPFKTSPVPNFRANPLMAVVRKGAVRPTINLSAPKGSSFKDNVDKYSLEKVHMSTAQCFGYAVRKCGLKAKMSKFDKKDAYKLIPAKKCDWNKQGFSWLGRYFLELQQIFGGIPSVCNFNRLGNTIMAIALAKCEIPRYLAFRTLDDVPVVAPNRTTWCEEFSVAFKKTCREANIRIAQDCPANDKAFTNQTVGTVLGIRFDTNKMEWSLHKDKADELIRRLLWAVDADCMSLKQTQQLLGSMNDLAQMCPFIKPYKALMNGFLKTFRSNEQILLKICDQTRKDLLVCANVAETARKGIPIPVHPLNPSQQAITCYSDAAGSKFAIANGERRNLNKEGDRKAASIILDKNSNPISWSRLTWQMFFLNHARDEKKAYLLW
jgi:hypothetical protein